MPDGYRYEIDQCDVPIERRTALKQFRGRRRLWVSWLHTDEIHPIWPTLHTMVWTDVAFRTLTGFAVGNDENALNNPLLVEALLSGHAATQVLAIRRLMEDSPKDRISLRRLIRDLNRHFDLITRENYVCCDGLPYDYEVVRDARLKKLTAGQEKVVFNYDITEGPEADGASELLHERFDNLAGIDPARRSREDRLPKSLLTTVEKWLDDSGAEDLVEWTHHYLAHAAGPNERARIADLRVTTDKITDATKALARAAEAMSLIVYAGGRSGFVMPDAPFDQFQRLDKPIMRAGDEHAARDRWDRLSLEWNDCLNGVEDELICRASPSSRGGSF
jgi:hypothetical protein